MKTLLILLGTASSLVAWCGPIAPATAVTNITSTILAEWPMSIDNTNLVASFSNHSLTIGFKSQELGSYLIHVLIGTNRVMMPMGNNDISWTAQSQP